MGEVRENRHQSALGLGHKPNYPHPTCLGVSKTKCSRSKQRLKPANQLLRYLSSTFYLYTFNIESTPRGPPWHRLSSFCNQSLRHAGYLIDQVVKLNWNELQA